MPFDPQLVPVAHKHCVDVVHEVGNSKHDVSAGQPVPVQKTRLLILILRKFHRNSLRRR